MQSLLQDLRFAARMLRRSGGVTFAVIAALALGIGAISAMYSVVDASLLHPVTYADPQTLALLWERDTGGAHKDVSAADFLDWRAQAKSFSELAGGVPGSYVLATGDRPEQILGAAVTANFFRTLGVKPLLGRAFLAGEDGIDNPAEASRVCLIGYRLWQESLGGDPHILGRTLLLNQTSYAVIGVLPADFRFVSPNYQVWVPLALDRTNRDFHYLTVVGRRRAPLGQASAEMTALARALDQSYPKTNHGWGIEVGDLLESVVNRTFRIRVLLLAGALGLVLAMACTNAAGLLLARSAARNREIATRISLGATRSRLMRQLLTESGLLALAGGAAGLALARGLIQIARQVLPPYTLANPGALQLNAGATMFTLGVALGTGVLFGLAPALALTRPEVHEALKDSSRGSTGGRGRQRFRRLVVVAEVALALMLLASTGLMLESLRRLAHMELGFRPGNVLRWSLFLPSTKYDARAALDFHRRALERIAALPGVESATVASSLPLADLTMEVPFDAREAGRPENERPTAGYTSIGPEYLRTLGIPLRSGRDFTEADNETAPPVAIVNEAFVRRFFPDRNPVGQRLVLQRPILGRNGFGPPVEVELVGVIANVALSDLTADPKPLLYAPHAQNLWRRVSWFAVRTRVDPLGLARAARGVMAELDPAQPIDNLATMEQVFSDHFAEPRFQAQLMAAFAALALLLAVAGVYSINADAVAQRRHEIGLRMALGASPGRVLRGIMAGSLRLTLYGIALGILGAAAIASWLQSTIAGVRATDPWTLGGVALLLALIGAAACYIPARSATRIDPAVVLREE